MLAYSVERKSQVISLNPDKIFTYISVLGLIWEKIFHILK